MLKCSRMVLLGGAAVSAQQTCVGGPCGPAHQTCDSDFRPGAGAQTWQVPQFHLKDASCFVNDPNAPFYDEVHGMYHVM
jgi:hypothetical protein